MLQYLSATVMLGWRLFDRRTVCATFLCMVATKNLSLKIHACMLAHTGTYDAAVSFGHCSVRQLTCAQVEAMSPSERVSSIFIK